MLETLGAHIENYYIGPNHEVSEGQLLPTTLEARQLYDQLTKQDPALYREELARKIKYSPRGVPYALLGGDNYSRTSVVGTKSPFANRVVPRPSDRFSWNLIIKTDFTRFDAELAGVVDEDGKTKPFLLVGNPASDHLLDLPSK